MLLFLFFWFAVDGRGWNGFIFFLTKLLCIVRAMEQWSVYASIKKRLKQSMYLCIL